MNVTKTRVMIVGEEETSRKLLKGGLQIGDQDVSLKNVAQGGVFIGGFSDVSDNGTGLNSIIGQDGIKVTMDNVTLGAVTIDAQTATLPANIMNVSNNTGNGVNVIVNNGSVIGMRLLS